MTTRRRSRWNELRRIVRIGGVEIDRERYRTLSLWSIEESLPDTCLGDPIAGWVSGDGIKSGVFESDPDNRSTEWKTVGGVLLLSGGSDIGVIGFGDVGARLECLTV